MSDILEKLTTKITEKILNQLDGRSLGIGFLTRLTHHGSPYHNRRGFIVSVTTRCNFHCPHCLREEVDKRKTINRDLPISVLEEALKEGKKINFQFVSFTGGEPILHPQFEEMISLTNKYGYRFNFASNGWLHKEYWDILKKYFQNLDFIFLSLDGTTSEVHDAVRNKLGSFDKLIETISFYKKQNLPLMATFCVTKKNFHQIEKLPDFCLGLGIKRLKWATVIPVYGENGMISLEYALSDNERTEALEKIINLRERFKSQCDILVTRSFYPPSRLLT